MTEMIPSQIDYTSRDYESLRLDLIDRVREKVPEWQGSDPADFGVVLLEAFAYMGDILSYYIDRAANESSLTTATRRSSVIALARQLGYRPFGYRPSTVTLTFANSGDATVVVPARTVVTAVLESDGVLMNIPFETDDPVEVSANGVGTVTATQGDVVRGEYGFGVVLGLSDGATNQRFLIPDQNVSSESVEVFTFDGVNFTSWTRVDYPSDFTPLSKIFSVIYSSTGAYGIEFGDGVSGYIPPTGHQILCRYRIVDGVKGNVPASSIKEITSIPGLSTSQVAALSGTLAVINYAAASGGTNEQSTQSIRTQAPKFFRAAHRAVTISDFEDISLGVTGCGKASAKSDGLGTVTVAVAPYRDISLSEDRPGFLFNDPNWELTPEMTDLIYRVRSTLNQKKLVGTSVAVVEPVYVDLQLEVSVQVIPSLPQESARTIIREQILTRLDYTRVEFSSSVYISDIVSLITDLGIATSVSVDVLKRTDSETALGTIESDFDEIVRLKADDLTINLTGGIEEALENL